MSVGNEARRTPLRWLGAVGTVGAVAGTAATMASTAPSSAASPDPGPRGDDHGAPSMAPTAEDGVYESCTALFGLTDKNSASWVEFDVESNSPMSPPVTVGPELRAIVTVQGGPGETDVECEATEPTWIDEAGWRGFVADQRGAGVDTDLYPYPGGPGHAIPVLDRSYAPTPGTNLLTAAITPSRLTVSFLEDSARFSITGGSPQEITSLSWAGGLDRANAQIAGIDPAFDSTIAGCRESPPTPSDDAISAAVLALGSVWGIDVDAEFPPASGSTQDRCTALLGAYSTFSDTAYRSLTVGSTAVVVVQAPAPPTTTTTTTRPTTTTIPAGGSTTTTAPNDGGVAGAGALVTPSFTG